MSAHTTWTDAGLDRLAAALKAPPAHTPGPWVVAETAPDDEGYPETVIRGMGGLAGVAVAIDFGSLPGMREANATLIAAAPELLAELRSAHQIIKVMLSCMTITQKLDAADKVERLGLIGPSGGTTRFHEREDLIAKATGSAA